MAFPWLKSNFTSEPTEISQLFDHLKKTIFTALSEFDFLPAFIRILSSPSNDTYKLSILRIILSIFRYSKEVSDEVLASKPLQAVAYLN